MTQTTSRSTSSARALRLARLQRRSDRWQRELQVRMKGAFDGLWLGILDAEALAALDELYYAGEGQYVDAAYNEEGLRPWESAVVEAHFTSCRRIVVTSTGGGREVLALLERGFDVAGFEPNAAMAEFAADLVARHGHGRRVHRSERDVWPAQAGDADGVVIGWGSYSLIAGRGTRVELLRQARRALPTGAPLLLSYQSSHGGREYLATVRRVGSAVRRLRGRAPLDEGDALSPNFVHFFDLKQIEEELSAAGFELIDHGGDQQAWAVGTAR